MEKIKKILETLEKMYPDAKCSLEYKNVFELTIATVLSAQTTDKRVNVVTKQLFFQYPDSKRLASAKEENIIKIILPLGLAHSKAKNIIQIAKQLDTLGYIPDEIDELILLPGVGRKTANVIISEGFKKPGLAVDTHVGRVSWRLGLVKSQEPLQIEKQLKQLIDIDMWSKAHHLLLFFGRYFCKSKNPNCIECPFKEICNNNINNNNNFLKS